MLLLHTFLAILQVLVMQCQDLALSTSLVVLLLVLQSQDLLLPALLDDAVFFALIIVEFLEIFFVLSFVSNCMQ